MNKIEKPLKELHNVEVLLQAITIYRRHFIELFTPLLVSSMLTGLTFSVALTHTSLTTTIPIESDLNILISRMKTFFAITLLAVIISWILNMSAGGIVVKYTSNLLEEKNLNFIDAFKTIIKKLPTLLATSIISGLLIAIGFTILIVPGIIFSIMFFLFIPTIVIEGGGVISSLKRSRKLVTKRWMKTFGLMLILTALIWVASFTSGFISGIIQSFLDGAISYINFLFSSIISALIAPIYFISLTLYYYSMIIKEQNLPQPPIIMPQETKYCIQCGARISIKANFCPICGAKQFQNIN